MGFWSSLGGAVKRIAPTAVGFIPGVGPLAKAGLTAGLGAAGGYLAGRGAGGGGRGGDAYDLYRQDRERALRRQEELDRELGESGRGYRENEEAYRRVADPMFYRLVEQGGYTPEEATAVLRDQELYGLQQSADEAGRAFLTPEEQAAIKGDPGRARGMFRPGQLESIEREGMDRVRGTLTDRERRLADVVGATEGRVREAIPEERLRLTPGFQEGLLGTVGATRGRISPEKLGLSGRFQERYPLSDAEVEALGSSAARDVGSKFRTAAEDVERRAFAAGMNPLGAAAARERLETRSAAEAGDALARARLGARREQREGEREMESMRLGAERGRAGVELELGGREAELRRAGEGMRIGTEQDIASRRQRGAEYLGDLESGIEERTGALRSGAEERGTERGLGVARGIQQTGIQLEQDIDDREYQRALQAGMNRQEAERYVQGERYRRGLTQNQLLSGRAQDVAGARREDEREGRGYFAGQQRYFGGRAGETSGQRIGLYGAGEGAAGAATRGYAGYDVARRGQPGTAERIFSGAAGVIGAAAPYFGGQPRQTFDPYATNRRLGMERATRENEAQGRIRGAVRTQPAIPPPPNIQPTWGGGYEHGGIITRPTVAVLGESGPEMVTPLPVAQPRRRIGYAGNAYTDSTPMMRPAYA